MISRRNLLLSLPIFAIGNSFSQNQKQGKNMKNILIISGHPDLEKSVSNATILDEFSKKLPEAKIRKLSELYPDYKIDVKAEQEAVLTADILVWQFPFYWYSTPALMKKWIDDVFLYGFAYGSQAKIKGKKLLISISTGADENSYKKEGFMQHEMKDYFAGFESTAILCGLDLLKVMYVNGMNSIGKDEATIKQLKEKAISYADSVIEVLKNA